jgi:dolichyl-phosphate beta-glucosyltransferase
MDSHAIVIPCYNEGNRLKKEVFVNFIKTYSYLYFIFVNDGSTDNTQDLLSSMAGECPEMIKSIELEKNSGKAEAIRFGIKYILNNFKTTSVGYWDADLSTPLSELPNFIHFLSANQKIHFLIGSRIKRIGAHIKRSEIRHYVGRIFATAASLILKLPVYDTQCGAKLLRSELARVLFEEKFLTRWLFDIELIARMIEELGYPKAINSIYELPLNKWVDDGESKLKTIDFVRTPFDLIKIKYNYRKILR